MEKIDNYNVWFTQASKTEMKMVIFFPQLTKTKPFSQAISFFVN